MSPLSRRSFLAATAALFGLSGAALRAQGLAPTEPTVAALLGLRFVEHAGNPLIAPPWPTPILADPTFLTPDETPDGQWHLFAHSLLGIHHYESADALLWRRSDAAPIRWAIRPFVRATPRGYLLFYERVLGLFPAMHSRLEVRRSDDLKSWSEPAVMLAPSLAWHRHGGRRGTVGNPCVVQDRDRWVLYYSGGMSFLPDCGFHEPRHIGRALAPHPTGPWVPDAEPLLSPDPVDPWMNLGAGSMKVVRARDGWVAFQNGIYRDACTGRTGSAIRRLVSSDGVNFSKHDVEPIIAPGDGWQRSHVYALDVRRHAGRWYLYYNARDGWRVGTERIGLATSA